MTGNDWNVHGISKYCCYSIYEQQNNSGDDGDEHRDNKDDDKTWTPLIVNHVLDDCGKDTTESNPDPNTDNSTNGPPKTFTWA